jgi:hypothetical protein
VQKILLNSQQHPSRLISLYEDITTWKKNVRSKDYILSSDFSRQMRFRRRTGRGRSSLIINSELVNATHYTSISFRYQYHRCNPLEASILQIKVHCIYSCARVLYKAYFNRSVSATLSSSSSSSNHIYSTHCLITQKRIQSLTRLYTVLRHEQFYWSWRQY